MAEVPRGAVDVDVLRVEARTALVERAAQHEPHLGEPLARLPDRERLGRLVVVHARRPQRFVGVDVADAADEGLVEQRPLDGRAPGREPSQEEPLIEGGVERVSGDVGHLARDARQRQPVPGRRAVARRQQRVDGHRAEDALIDEVDPQRAMHRMRQREPDARERRGLGRRVAQQHLPAHAQVGDEGLGRGIRTRPIMGLDRQPQELAAPHRPAQPGPGQALDEVFRRAVMALERALVEHLDRVDRRARDGGLQAVAHDLDLGKLGHGGGPGLSAATAARRRPRAPRPSRLASCSCPRPWRWVRRRGGRLR